MASVYVPTGMDMRANVHVRRLERQMQMERQMPVNSAQEK
jgi:hypothetical protein